MKDNPSDDMWYERCVYVRMRSLRCGADNNWIYSLSHLEKWSCKFIQLMKKNNLRLYPFSCAYGLKLKSRRKSCVDQSKNIFLFTLIFASSNTFESVKRVDIGYFGFISVFWHQKCIKKNSSRVTSPGV